MKRVLRVAALAATFSLGGCLAMSPYAPVTGLAYANVGGPIMATNYLEKPTKVGRATARSILGYYASGEATIEAASRNGGITKIHHVDYEVQSVLGIVADYTVVVYGN